MKEGKKKVDQEGLLHVISTCLLVGERLSIIRVSCWIIQQKASSKRRARTIHDSEKFALRESQACQAGTAKLWVHQEELSWQGSSAHILVITVTCREKQPLSTFKYKYHDNDEV